MGEVEFVTGPAGSGKTAAVRADYRQYITEELRQGQFGRTLWIAPSQRCRQTVLESLLASDFSVCLDPRVETFGQVVEQLLASANEDYRPLSQVGRRKLVRDVIDQLTSDGKLTHFRQVAPTRGFLDLCVSFIAELKREEIWPEQFQAAMTSAPPSQPTRETSNRDSGETAAISRRITELALIYETYQQRLRGGELSARAQTDQPEPGQFYDTEGRFWIARTLLRSGFRGPYSQTQLVVVDGFTDFTSTQIEILALLAAGAGRMLITLPLDERGQRTDLFSQPLAALQELRNAFSQRGIAVTRRNLPRAGDHPTFSHIARHLFDNPREVPRLDEANDCEILSCIRPGGEIDAVLLRVKKLLLAGQRPDEIAIVFRSLRGVGERIGAACQAAGIPAAVATGPPVLAAGSVRTAISILDLEREDWPFRRLMGLLNATLFRPRWLTHVSAAVVRRIGSDARAENLDRNRQAYLACFNRLAATEQQSKLAQEERQQAAKLLQRISDELAVLRERATFGQWVDRWLAVCGVFGVEPRNPDSGEAAPAWLQAEFSGWKALLRLIEDARKVEALSPVAPRMLDVSEFRDQVLELIAGQNSETPTSERGRVRILPADEARQIAVDHLFICGLGEGEFPQGRREDALLAEADRGRLSSAGLNAPHRFDEATDEMLRFYSVVTQARRAVTLSYASVSDRGEMLNPSPYLQAIDDLFAAGTCPPVSVGRLDPVPETRLECATESAIRLLATRELLSGAGGLWAKLVERTESRETMLTLAAALDMSAARFATRGLTNYEGVLSDPGNRKRLARRFGPAHEFSVTELERYASDPFEFFLGVVLGLDAQQEPGPGTDRLRRGITLHASLAAAHRKLSAAPSRPDREELLETLREEIAAAHRTGGDSRLVRVLRSIEAEILAGYGETYLSQWDDYETRAQAVWKGAPRPVQFEVAFGNAPTEVDLDESERRPTVAFGAGENAVQVRGKIDRIDAGFENGEPVFNIVDYKLSKDPHRFSRDDLESGRDLQLAVYGVVARRLGLVAGDIYQLGYWGLEGKGFITGIKPDRRKFGRLEDDFRERLDERLDEILPRLVAAIRSGRFAPNVQDVSRPFAAPFRAVARTASLRAVAERLNKHLTDELLVSDSPSQGLPQSA